jgi:hypothetical protein
VVEESDPEAHRKAQRRETRQMVGLVVLFTLIAAGGWWVWGKVTQADDNSQSAASPTATAPVDDVEAEVEAAYRAYIAMGQRLVAAPNPDDPEIPERTTGSALARVKAVLADDLARGHVIRTGPASSQTILSIDVDGDQATLRACFVDESGLFDAATGAEIEPVRIVTAIDTVVLQRESGAWRVSNQKTPAADEQWEGATTCER